MVLKIAGVLGSNGEWTPLNSHFGKAELRLVPALNPIPFGLFFVLILSGGANLPTTGIYVKN